MEYDQSLHYIFSIIRDAHLHQKRSIVISLASTVFMYPAMVRNLLESLAKHGNISIDSETPDEITIHVTKGYRGWVEDYKRALYVQLVLMSFLKDDYVPSTDLYNVEIPNKANSPQIKLFQMSDIDVDMLPKEIPRRRGISEDEYITGFLRIQSNGIISKFDMGRGTGKGTIRLVYDDVKIWDQYKEVLSFTIDVIVPPLDDANTEKKVIREIIDGIYLVEDKMYGYIRYNDTKEDVQIGKLSSKQYKLLKVLSDPFNVQKNVSTVYAAMVSLDQKRTAYVSTAKTDNEHLVKIENARKELQRGNKLRDIFDVIIDRQKSTVKLTQAK